jgi:glutathione S-transferase
MATYLGRTDLAPAYHLRAERFVNDSSLEAAGSEVAVPLAKNGRPDVRGGCEESPNIYPTFTYADDPARFVEGEATQQVFERKVGAYRERLWRQVETVVGASWFLRPRFSALDIYIAVMTRWRPRRGCSRRNAWEPERFRASLQHGAGISISTVTRIGAKVAGHRRTKPFQPGSDRALL